MGATDLQMNNVILQCRVCGLKKKFVLNVAQIRRLAAQQLLLIRCGFCASDTEWEPAEPIDISITSVPTVKKKPRQKNVLVVDDDDLTLKLLQKVLGSFETHIEVAQSGREAFAKLAEQPFDLVICDIHMPGMSGPELFQHIQDNALLPAQRIIFLTGDKSPATKEFLDRSGCSYLYKPIQFLDFSGQVQAVLAGETLD